MTGWQLTLAAGLYAWTAWDYAKADRGALCIAFICYAIANLGFAWDMRR